MRRRHDPWRRGALQGERPADDPPVRLLVRTISKAGRAGRRRSARRVYGAADSRARSVGHLGTPTPGCECPNGRASLGKNATTWTETPGTGAAQAPPERNPNLKDPARRAPP